MKCIVSCIFVSSYCFGPPCCRIPDFRKLATDAHTQLLAEIYQHLQGAKGRLPTDWLAQQIEHLNRTDGDIEALTHRIAGIRIWTYVAFRGDWMADSNHWQERSREIENNLSDVLHERLMQRFVDKRTSHLVRRLRENRELLGAVRNDGEVLVEGHPVGQLTGFRFAADHFADGKLATKAIERAVLKALRPEILRRIDKLVASSNDTFALSNPEISTSPDLLWHNVPIARLATGEKLLQPRVIPFKSNLLDNQDNQRIYKRLTGWLANHIRDVLAPLFANVKNLPAGVARGLYFRLTENLGSIPRRLLKNELDALDPDARRSLRAVGFKIGRESIYAPVLLKPRAVTLRGVLWAINNGLPFPLPLPGNGRASIRIEKKSRFDFFEAIGYRPLGPLAIRVEILERVASEAWSLGVKGTFEEPAQLMNLIGCHADELAEVLKHLGYHREASSDTIIYRPKKRQAGRTGIPPSHSKPIKFRNAGHKRENRRQHRKNQSPTPQYDPDSPFAKLHSLNLHENNQP